MLTNTYTVLILFINFGLKLSRSQNPIRSWIKYHKHLAKSLPRSISVKKFGKEIGRHRIIMKHLNVISIWRSKNVQLPLIDYLYIHKQASS